MRYNLLVDLVVARRERHRVAVITDLASGEQRLVKHDAAARDLLADELEQAFRLIDRAWSG